MTSDLSAAMTVPSGHTRRARPYLPYVVVLAAALILPFTGNDYWAVIAARAALYWVLISGLNLVVGFGGQLAVGYVALLTIGAYTASIVVADTSIGPFWAFIPSAALGAICGAIIGLPALRLRTFYFAMTTLGFSTIVTQVAQGWRGLTGGGVGLAGPTLPPPFDTPWGTYCLCLIIAALCTWITANVAHSRFGRALMGLRDAEVAAEAMGVSKPALLVAIFLFSGALAGIAGELFAVLQSYITPDAFTFDLSVLFFIAILIGGRGSILGPLLGTVLLTVLPEFAAPLVAWSTFLYAALLLLIVIAIPGGIADLLDFRNRRPMPEGRVITPHPAWLDRLLDFSRGSPSIELRDVTLSFGGVKAVDGLTLTVKAGVVHGLIGPNGSGKTTTLNLISGFSLPNSGSLECGGVPLPVGAATRAVRGIARTFQTPRIIGEATVLQNVMMGGTVTGRCTFLETLLRLPRHVGDEARLAAHARAALRAVGLGEDLADVRADRLQHSELRFLEIARALMLNPIFLLLDEPAAGLSADEIKKLGSLVTAIARSGTGVLLVEHHADLIFDICDTVTVLNVGRELTTGTPAEIRAHRDVIGAYLGG